MRKVTRAALVLAGSAALIGVTTVPSFAATTGTTPTTVTVPAGVLAITVPAGATLSTGTPGANSTVTLAATQVTDERAGITGWIATVSLPALTSNVLIGKTIVTTTATYLAVAATLTGGPTVAAPTLKTDLSTAKTSQAATATNGNNTASWAATLTVSIPAQALADTYSGTLTQSVS